MARSPDDSGERSSPQGSGAQPRTPAARRAPARACPADEALAAAAGDPTNSSRSGEDRSAGAAETLARAAGAGARPQAAGGEPAARSPLTTNGPEEDSLDPIHELMARVPALLDASDQVL